jgi:hypothetical protein
MQTIEDVKIHSKNTQTPQTDPFSEGNAESKLMIQSKNLLVGASRFGFHNVFALWG